MGRTQFAAQHPHLFLLITRAAVDDDPAGFFTETASEDEIHAGLEATTLVAQLVKRAGNPYPDRISIGRARNCDVAIADASLSKLHAHVRRDGAGWSIVDLGSQNGTSLDGKPLKANAPIPLAAGADLVLGTVRARVLDATGIYDALASLGAWR